MRDEKDSGTVEMALPVRRGRPPKGDAAMTAADRAAAYRRRRKYVTKTWTRAGELSDAALVDSIRDLMGKPHMREMLHGALAEVARRYPVDA